MQEPIGMNYFVYVVCGAKEYIDQLHFSLLFLRHFSKYPIYVATDTMRNEIPIEHDNLIDVKTPQELNNHQAHLYIETSLHKHLHLYDGDKACYIDSDVIALNTEINDVFSHFQAPVTFAGDHCTIDLFSPKITHCGCTEAYKQKAELYAEIQKILPCINPDDKETKADVLKHSELFAGLRNHPVKYFFKALTYCHQRYISRKPQFSFGGFSFVRKNAVWYNKRGNIISFDFRNYNRLIHRKLGVRFNGKYWVDDKNNIIKPELPVCSHLREYLQKTYNIHIPENFRHWNGGVFLFGSVSQSFMDLWHEITMKESFAGNIMYYDDQSSLIATSFITGSQGMGYLPDQFNFIADFNNPKICWNVEKGYSRDGFATAFKPAFIHVYHNWGDETWNIWQSVLHLGRSEGILS